MSRVTCVSCGKSDDDRSMTACPSCGQHVCNSCYQRYGGCGQCATAVNLKESDI